MMARLNLGQLIAQRLNHVAGATNKYRHTDGHTALPSGTDTGADQLAYHLLRIGVGHDHHVVFGASKALSTLHMVGGRAVDMLTYRYRANKGHRFHIRMADQLIDLLFTAMHDLQNIFRRTGL